MSASTAKTRPVGLILGAAVGPAGPSPTLQRRARAGVAAWAAGQVSHLVACGGMGRFPPTEAEAIAAILSEAGVPAAAIHLEDRSRTTEENIRFALPILRGLGAGRVVIFTDRLHVPRACLVARRLGLEARGGGPGLRAGSPRSTLRMAWREPLAYLAYALRGAGR